MTKNSLETLENRLLCTATLSNNVLTITGTTASDAIVVSKDTQQPADLVVTINGTVSRFVASNVASIQISALAGNDRVEISQTQGIIAYPTTILGSDGADTLIGASGRDRIEGGNGADSIFGYSGSDILRGGSGVDTLIGGRGNDNLAGNGSSDLLFGQLDADIFHTLDGLAERQDQQAADLVIDDGQKWSDINDFTYQLQNIDLTTIGNSQFDAAVIDYSLDADDASRWTRSQISNLQNSAGGVKKVLAYMSVGEAENYRFYWQSTWDANNDGTPDAGAPSWLSTENPDWPGNYKVKYWDTNWQKIVFSYMDRIIAQGFDGVYLDIIDGYEYWGPDGINQRPTAAQDMVDFVKNIARYARITRGVSDFVVIPQNGAALGTHADYLATVTGIGREDVWYNDDAINPTNEVATSLTELDRFKTAGKFVWIIDYPQQTAHINDFYTKATNKGYIPYAPTRDLDQLKIVPGHSPD